MFLPIWIRKCNKLGLLWEDMNKYGHPKNVAASGGIIAVMAFVLGVLSYIAIRTFVRGLHDGANLEIFGLLGMILILSTIGLVDDLLGWKHGGISKRMRVILAALAAIPLIAINAGVNSMNFPFFGTIPLGILYPLVFIPIGVAGAATTYNFLAGMNGLEAGQGIIILTFLSFVAFAVGKPWLALVGVIMVFALLGFYYYNKHPAKVFPGGSLTYSIGALIAGMAILGNFEKIAVFVFIPYIVEVVLKMRGKLKEQSFGIPDKNDNLSLKAGKIYGLTHLAIFVLSKLKKQVSERDVVYSIFVFQIVICLLALLMI